MLFLLRPSNCEVNTTALLVEPPECGSDVIMISVICTETLFAYRHHDSTKSLLDKHGRAFAENMCSTVQNVQSLRDKCALYMCVCVSVGATVREMTSNTNPLDWD